MLKTERLLLRQWTEEDQTPFAAMCHDKDVMQKIGMSNSHNNFLHPDFESSHPQCEHVLYKINKLEWEQNAL